jgi:galactokinase
MGEPTLSDSAQRMAELCREHRAHFAACYGAGPAPRVFFAPGRVNLFGGHLDYNGGPVMPTAIDRGTLIALRPRRDRRLRLASTLDPDGLELALDSPPLTRRGRWVDYPLGVVQDLLESARERGHLARLEGCDVLFGGNLPVGAGLSSSASICVGSAFAFDHLWGLELGTEGRVASALRAERGFVGVQCGIMDPYAVGLARPGHILWLDCKDVTWRHLPLDFASVSIGVANSGVRRELAAVAFNERVAQCAEAFRRLAPHAPGASCLRDVTREALDAHKGELPAMLLRRAEHVVGEVQRTFEARAAVLAGDLARMGTLMTETHGSLREQYEVSCPELDLLVEAAVGSNGVFGSRLTGAGFGGCTVMLVAKGSEDAVRDEVQERFRAVHGRTPEVDFFAGDEGPRELEEGA